MNGYCHTDVFDTRYSDFDYKDELHLSAYLSFAQEVAGNSADELGFGYRALKKENLGFIVASTYCRIFRPVVLGERVEVQTWPLPPRHVIFERDYRIKVGGEVRAALASRWCLVDLNAFSLQTGERLGKTHENCPYNPEKSVEVPLWKIPKLTDGGREVYRMRVGTSRCDHYLHANNCRYADFFVDCFAGDELKGVSAFQISYIKQAKEGEELVFFRKDEEGGSVCECRNGDELVSQFRVRFADGGQV